MGIFMARHLTADQVSYGGAGYIFGNVTSGYGTIFEMTPSGTLTNLFLFDEGNRSPNCLVQGIDGGLYGTTQGGNGSVYKISTAGLYTNLVSFNGDNGQVPTSLVQGPGGVFFGATRFGGGTLGNYGYGNIFQVTTNGVITTLHNFNENDGMFPSGKLVLGTDGCLYGTTQQGGSSFGKGQNGRGYGTVFKFVPIVNGSLTVLHSFTNGTDGAYPLGGITQGKDDSFYGTTSAGGLTGVNGGTVFRVSGPAKFNSITATTSNSIQLAFNVSLGQTNFLQGSTNLVDWVNLNTYTQTNGIFLFFDTNILQCRFYRIYVP